MPWLCMHVGTLVYAVYWLPETGIEYTGNRSCKAGDRLVIVCIAVVWLEPFLCNRF